MGIASSCGFARFQSPAGRRVPALDPGGGRRVRDFGGQMVRQSSIWARQSSDFRPISLSSASRKEAFRRQCRRHVSDDATDGAGYPVPSPIWPRRSVL